MSTQFILIHPAVNMNEIDVKIKFIENDLIKRIISNNNDFKNKKLIKQNVTTTSTINGFTSTIIMVELVMRCNLTKWYFLLLQFFFSSRN